MAHPAGSPCRRVVEDVEPSRDLSSLFMSTPQGAAEDSAFAPVLPSTLSFPRPPTTPSNSAPPLAGVGNTSVISDGSPTFNASLLAAVSAVESSQAPLHSPPRLPAPALALPVTPTPSAGLVMRAAATTPFKVEGESPIPSPRPTASGPGAPSVSQSAALRLAASTLTAVYGLSDFRPGQEEAVVAALQGRDIFLLMPTGAGKTLAFTLPALCCRGVTVIVSPLLALIQDQAEKLAELGVPVGIMASSSTPEDSKRVGAALAAMARPGAPDAVKVLFTTPEKLVKSSALQSTLAALSTAGALQRIVVDEAHCISQWGHDFRPELRSLSCLRGMLRHVPITCATATATPRTQTDIASVLGLVDPLMVRLPFDRPNIKFTVQPKGSAGRMATDIANLHRAAVESHGREARGIVYAHSRKQVERMAQLLQEALGSRCVAFYHAGLPMAQRCAVQRDWQRGSVPLVVASVAFGMGVDAGGVRYVVHTSAPRSMTHLYQEAGRGGRDGGPCLHRLYYAASDVQTLMHHATADAEAAGTPPLGLNRTETEAFRERGRTHAQARLAALTALQDYAGGATRCRRRVLLEAFEPGLSDQAHAEPAPGCCDVCDYILAVQGSAMLSSRVRAAKAAGALGNPHFKWLGVREAARGALQMAISRPAAFTASQLADGVHREQAGALTKGQCSALVAHLGREGLLTEVSVKAARATYAHARVQASAAGVDALAQDKLPPAMPWRFAVKVRESAPLGLASPPPLSPTLRVRAAEQENRGVPAPTAQATLVRAATAPSRPPLAAAASAVNAQSQEDAKRSKARGKARERRVAAKADAAATARRRNGSSILSFFTAGRAQG